MNVAAQTATTDPGVTINGVTWATCNVDAPGTFAQTPESAGMFYHFDRKEPYYNATDPNKPANWDNTQSSSLEWRKENDPSPTGWRVPTPKEIESLLDGNNVEKSWDAERLGVVFTDKASGNSIFFPSRNYRYGNGTLWNTPLLSYYFSNTQKMVGTQTNPSVLSVNNDYFKGQVINVGGRNACFVRPVKADRTAARTPATPTPVVTLPATSQPKPQPQKLTAPAFQPSVEDQIIGTWMGEEALGVTGLYTFYPDNTCTMWHITPEGYYTDFGWMAAEGKDVVNVSWKITKEEALEIDGEKVTVQTIECNEGDDGAFTFIPEQNKLYWRSSFEYSRVTSPDAVPVWKMLEREIPSIDSDTFLVGSFTGAQMGCAWGEPTGEVINPGSFSFNADGTTENYIRGLDEPHYWSVKERNVTRTTRVQTDDPCKHEEITVTGQVITMGMKYADGSWKMSSWVFVFEYGGYTYINSQKYRRTE